MIEIADDNGPRVQRLAPSTMLKLLAEDDDGPELEIDLESGGVLVHCPHCGHTITTERD